MAPRIALAAFLTVVALICVFAIAVEFLEALQPASSARRVQIECRSSDGALLVRGPVGHHGFNRVCNRWRFYDDDGAPRELVGFCHYPELRDRERRQELRGVAGGAAGFRPAPSLDEFRRDVVWRNGQLVEVTEFDGRELERVAMPARFTCSE